MWNIMHINYALTMINYFVLPAALVYLYRKRRVGCHFKGLDTIRQYLFSAVVLFILTRTVLMIPTEVLGILTASLLSRFFTAAYTMAALGIICFLAYFSTNIQKKSQ